MFYTHYFPLRNYHINFPISFCFTLPKHLRRRALLTLITYLRKAILKVVPWS